MVMPDRTLPNKHRKVSEPTGCEEFIGEIKGLGNQIADVKTMLEGNEKRIRAWKEQAIKRLLVVRQNSDLEEKTDDHDEQLKELRELLSTQTLNVNKFTNSFESMQKIWKWALGIFHCRHDYSYYRIYNWSGGGDIQMIHPTGKGMFIWRLWFVLEANRFEPGCNGAGPGALLGLHQGCRWNSQF